MNETGDDGKKRRETDWIVTQGEKRGDQADWIEIQLGSFTSLESANELVSETLAKHQDAVQRVTGGQTEMQYIEHDFGKTTGYESYRPLLRDTMTVRPTTGIAVLLVHTEESRGFSILTAYPRNFDGGVASSATPQAVPTANLEMRVYTAFDGVEQTIRAGNVDEYATLKFIMSERGVKFATIVSNAPTDAEFAYVETEEQMTAADQIVHALKQNLKFEPRPKP